MKKLITIALIITATFSIKAQYFVEDTTFYLMDGAWVYCLEILDNDLFISGSFNTAGGDTARGLVKWDGQNFYPVGYGFTYDDYLQCAVEYQGNEYFGGGFNELGSVWKTASVAGWDGNQYFSIVDLMNSNPTIYDMVVWHDTLYVGGDNFQIGGSGPVYWGMAAYDGTQWIDVGYQDSPTWTMVVYNDQIYASGGYFTCSLKRHVGGTTWEDFGFPSTYVYDMTVDTINNFLYVAGGFEYIDYNKPTDNVAIWNGFYWETIGGGSGMNSSASCIELYRGDLYVGVDMDSIGGVHTGRLARWDGQDWHMVGNPPLGLHDIGINKMIVYKDTLYIGGGSWPEAPLNGTDTLNWGVNRWYMPPDTTCKYLKPRVFTDNNVDTFYLSGGQVEVPFYNNNAYVQTWDWDFNDGGTDTIKDPLHTFTDSGTYNVCVTVNDTGCVKTACKTVTILNNTNINVLLLSISDFKIYPNPTDGNFFVDINLSEIKGLPEIRIFNPQGILKAKYPLQQGKNHIEISSNSWEAGSYLVCLMVGNKLVKSKKLVLTK